MEHDTISMDIFSNYTFIIMIINKHNYNYNYNNIIIIIYNHNNFIFDIKKIIINLYLKLIISSFINIIIDNNN